MIAAESASAETGLIEISNVVSGMRFKRRGTPGLQEMGNKKYQRIWKVVTLIPPGKVASYGQVADLSGLPANARLVSRALKSAPEDLELPWHRVVNAHLRISFPYATPGYLEQRRRLAAEGVLFRGRRIDRECHWRPDLSVLLWQLEG